MLGGGGGNGGLPMNPVGGIGRDVRLVTGCPSGDWRTGDVDSRSCGGGGGGADNLGFKGGGGGGGTKPLGPEECDACMGGFGRGGRGGVFVYIVLVLLLRAGVDGLDIVEPPF